ncbi:mediator of RNA polymerase II transcription subunit 5 [Plectosphaerella cucumerina]|uniref:Mediator of RNA polymerase II transcription subunit 5 n=1 Tax=Plectosphaerella cucumerina TaxID=40658 RepID=A0A8K0X3R3_9PEZI|nr:mediator of RNA polymerase II transcription subunit 5 [Plectosphaerella cucumerina]
MDANSGAQRDTLERWARFKARCLAQRLDPEQFGAFVPLLHLQNPLSAPVIADLFLAPQAHNHDAPNPRVPQYLQVLSKLGYIDTPSILSALYRYSTSHLQSPNTMRNPPDHAAETKSKSNTRRWRNSYGTEEVMFYRLTKAVAQGTGIKSPDDGLEVAKVMSKWMALFTDASTAFAVDAMGDLHTSHARDEMESARAAFVALLLGVCENQLVLKALDGTQARAARKDMSESLASFVPTIVHNADRIATRLDLFRTSTLAGFEPTDEKKEDTSAELDQLFGGTVDPEHFVIPEMPIVNSRAGLYIYLNAALIGRPLVDDATIINHLNNRYPGDVQSATIDLILASFDVLANAVFRNEGPKATHLLRSYLMNKLPLLISNLSKHMFPPLTPEYCITDALRRVDTNAFPTLSSMFDESRNNNPFTDSVREEFCWACCLHGLLPESSVEVILGETPYSSFPSRGRYMKDRLVGECLSDSERMQALVGELDNMDGNVGAASQALVEVLRQFCRNKDTMSLKALCGQLSRKPLALDVILLFEKPSSILYPLCELLDNWKYEEDQGEYQPVYEEFGSVLLLLLALAYRYNLGPSDVGVRSPESFVAKILTLSNQSRPSEPLSDQDKGHLDSWIRGLFDQEAGGLTDDLISSCPPQEFYLLIPALFQNIVLAVGTGHLSEEGLRGGVEYLVDTFLLPSLVTAITYLASLLWIDRQHQKAIMRILHFVIQPSAISSDASTMLSSVLNIVAKPLEHSLRAYQRQDPKCQEVEPLLRALKDSIPLSRRTGGADHNELETWSNTPNGGLTIAVRHTIHGFVQWGLQAGINMTPTPYTHRQIIAALRMLGAKRVLHLIYDEVRHQTELGSGSVAYDIATALVCAPDVTNGAQPSNVSFLDDSGNMPVPEQQRLSLRDVLKAEAEECRKLQKTDPAQAEMVVRLYRRVEAQMVMTQPAAGMQAEAMLPGDLALGLDGGAGSLESAMAAAAAAADVQSVGMSVDNVSLELGMGPMGSDLGLGDAGSVGVSLDMGADDMFGNLSAGGDFEWDNMDLS